MKLLIKKLLRESILSEKLTDVDTDVDMLYDKYFKEDIDTIERTGLVTVNMFEKFETNTSILTSPDSIKCHELNPCIIKINVSNNYYQPNNKIISIGVSKNAYNFVIDYADGNIESAAEAIKYSQGEHQRKAFIKEFTEARVKGSIHHELAHWIDDTLNNQHLKARINKAMERNTRDLGGIPVDATKMEIQGQIHNVKQLYNKYKDIWDKISFQDMLELSPPLYSINNRFTGETKVKWRKELKLRMNREGLLGKNMTN
jgi:hypothetical protein